MCDPIAAVSDLFSSASDAVSQGASDAANAVGNLFSSAPDASSAASGAANVASDAAASEIAALDNAGGSFSPTGSNLASIQGTPLAAPSTFAPAGITPAAAPTGTTGGGVSALGAGTPPGDVGSTATLGDQFFGNSNVGLGDRAADQFVTPSATGSPPAATGDGFGADRTPAQSYYGKPAAPDAGGGGGTGLGAGGGKPNSIMEAIRSPGADTILNAIGNNAGGVLGATGLALTGLRSQQLPQQVPLVGQAQDLSKAAAPLLAGLQTGQLPVGLQEALDEATQAQKASIRSQYAGMGLSNSTMEQQALNEVDRNAEAQKFQQIDKLVSTGLSETQLSAQLYQQLQQAQLAGDTELATALGNFASAVGGAGTGGTTIKLSTAA